MKTSKRKRLKLDDGGRFGLVEEEIKDSQSLNSKLKKKKTSLSITHGGEIGFSIVVPIAGGVLLGVYLDKKFNTAPKLTLVFLFLGVILSFMNLIRIIRDTQRK